jgi:luciferase family oxidoreductase group 1
VPLYILGSSLFGASLAAALGLPYAFASHFAPEALGQAVALYRREFRPSEQQATPYVIAGVNVVAADTEDEAREHFDAARRQRAVALFARGKDLSEAEAEALLDAGAAAHVDRMMACSAVGTPDQVVAQLADFAVQADADELITAHASPTTASRLHSLTLVGQAVSAVVA